jgi:hypothetical protein
MQLYFDWIYFSNATSESSRKPPLAANRSGAGAAECILVFPSLTPEELQFALEQLV